MKAETLNRLVSEFAPPEGQATAGQDFLVGDPGLEVDRFFVAWNPGQLDGIIRKSKQSGGSYVAYLGKCDEILRCLFSLGLKGTDGSVIRFVGSSWRYRAWGVAARIARDMGPGQFRPVFVAGQESNFKIVTFVPHKDLPKVRESLFSVGGGRYGLYSKCSFASPGKGTFLGDKRSKPAYGQAGRLEELEEERLEVMVPSDRLDRAVAAVRGSHPYEEPVIETYEIGSKHEFGEGRVGFLASPVSVPEASRRLASLLGSQPSYVSGDMECNRVLIWDGEPGRGLYEGLLRDVDLYVGADSRGLARLLAPSLRTEVIEFPRYCYVMAGAKELVYLVREKSKRESWGLRTFLPSKVGREGVHA